MSLQHKHQLIQEAFEKADEQIGKVHDLGLGMFAYAERTFGNDPQVQSFETMQEALESHDKDRFNAAARHVRSVAGFEEAHPFGPAVPWKSASHYAYMETERVSSNPQAVLSEWIDQHGTGAEAVKVLCAERAKQDLTALAQASQLGQGFSQPPIHQHIAEDLATPEQARAARQARLGRAM